MTQNASGGRKRRKHTFVTTDTGRILRVETGKNPVAPAPAPAAPLDPARREDVLFRVRREQGQEASPWWGVGAFIIFSTLVILLLGWVPGDA